MLPLQPPNHLAPGWLAMRLAISAERPSLGLFLAQTAALDCGSTYRLEEAAGGV
ncbi:hypothetical protein NHH88_13515 [Oxalobacteraceae bacterium OTU3CAMAD1]|nr:hypothetical protein NHH88_13515 [Oxalobacteraceae bacterium OTU3CAMAD1]